MNATAIKKRSRLAQKPPWQFCLYVADQTSKSLLAFEHLQRFCEERFPGQYHIEVIDVLAEPKWARADNIVALPTLVQKSPSPIRRVIGDLSNSQRILKGLHMRLSA